jgi:hypothetical protein
MTRVRHCLPIVTVACLTSIGPVQADNSVGELYEVQGTVLVNPGKNYFVGYSGMQLKPGARVLTLDGASAVVKQADGCLTRLEPNLRFILREPSICQREVATRERIGPSYTEAFSASTRSDGPAVAAGVTRDKGLPIDAANMALGGGADAITGSTLGTIGVTQQQQQDVDDRQPPISTYR